VISTHLPASHTAKLLSHLPVLDLSWTHSIFQFQVCREIASNSFSGLHPIAAVWPCGAVAAAMGCILTKYFQRNMPNLRPICAEHRGLAAKKSIVEQAANAE